MANKKVQESVPMLGGDGPHSYAQNSSYQKQGADIAKALMIEEIIEKLDFKNPNFDPLVTFKISDLGCSTGPNTFLAVKNIVEAVDHKYHTQLLNPSPLEFQVFFSDLIDNDFNTLFKTLPTHQKYFAAGVPGSFYDRLFPKSSLHFVHSSYALHWLSKVPKEVVDDQNPAWNKGSVYCSGREKEVVKAYSNQFKNDMNAFLNARAQEIVGGGLMAITIVGLPNEIFLFETRSAVSFELFGNSLKDMAKLGVISEEKVDCFNIPIYYTSPNEMEKIVKGNGHFRIERMDTFDHPTHYKKVDGKLLVSLLRAILEGLLKVHFEIGEDIIGKIFECFAEKIADNLSALDELSYNQTNIFIMLKRNIN